MSFSPRRSDVVWIRAERARTPVTPSLALAAWLGISLREFSLRLSLNDHWTVTEDRDDDAGNH
jgi:hypothetical protein